MRSRTFSLIQGGAKITTVVDLFGGSGLLSHAAKRFNPGLRVVYNDFDGYCDRLRAVEGTNAILSEIRQLLDGVPANARLSPELRGRVLDVVERHAASGYVDFMTIGRNVLFSGKWVRTLEQLHKHSMYNRVRPTGYNCEGYLDGLEVVALDYRELFDRFRNMPGVLFVLDPPYLTTECGQYENYWRLTDYLEVLKCTKGTNYIYFTSDKSQLVELCNWMASEFGNAAPLFGAEVHSRTNTLNYQAKFNDIMLVKMWSEQA